MPRPLDEAAGILGIPLSGAPSVTGVTHDSRAVVPGDLYAALPGFVTHGARFAADAVRSGAVAVLTDPEGRVEAEAAGVPVLVVPDPRSRLGELAAWAYGRPADDLLVLGVTGTNGKTTVTYLLDAGLRAAGHVTGIVGTVGTRIADTEVPTVRTTPEATDVHALLAVMRERGVTAVALEVSSHALVLGRVDGLTFDVAGFTNLSQDHLDFHGTMEDYFAAKSGLFTPPRSRRGVVCVDDDWGRRLAGDADVPVTTYALGTDEAEWRASAGPVGSGGARTLTVSGPGVDGLRLDVPLPGAFNAANALGALAMLVSAGVDPALAAWGIGRCRGVPGRMERVPRPEGRTAPAVAIVDYAHTPDAVARALTAVREGTSGRVLVVLGCGGDRDREKRPVMGQTAARLADVVVVTDDNPRSEDPAAIRQAVLDGTTAVPAGDRADVFEVGDRRAAVRAAVDRAGPDDVVLVLGKGHEQGQEVAGVTHPFDDRLVLREALEEVDR